MALQSQATRAGQSRRYMVSRRKSRKGPWVAIFVVAVALIGGYVYFYGSSTPATGSPDTNGSGDGQAGTTSTDTGDSERDPRQVAERNPLETRIDTGDSGGSATPPREERDRPTRNDPPVLTTPDPAGPLSGEAKAQCDLGLALLEEGRVIEGRAILSELLFRPPGSIPRHEAQAIRQRLTHLNDTLVFSREFVEGDPIAAQHTVQRGELLSRDIGPAFNTPYQFIMRINGIEDASRVPAGASIKCIRGPIHARIVKHEYRMDLFVEDPDGLRIYLCSYPVGLGEFDSTPAGLWRIKPRSKVVNPDWRNPRTGEYYERDAPNIPIGEYWMALEGMDDNTREAQGYGIHGTNEESSVGRQESMGCVRMKAQDVEDVFYMLSSGDSYVEILP